MNYNAYYNISNINLVRGFDYNVDILMFVASYGYLIRFESNVKICWY